ncbi:nuclease-related domain-containing protein [Chitinibacteraceae bacterium HSL-7]
MILKDKVFTESADKFQQAGDAAEREMAFYMKRYFADSPDFLVLHDLRLVLEDDVAQIDHLIIHAAGVTTVETKSVAGKIQMKEDGQWLRWYGNQSKGMASPLIQAKLQLELLKRILRKYLNKPEQLELIPFDSLIAISTQGIFLPPKENAPGNVCKTELVGEQLLTRSQSAGRIWQSPQMNKLAQFLISQHSPKQEAPAAAAPAPAPAPEAAPAKPGTTTLAHLDYVGDRLKPAGLLRGLLGGEQYRKVYATFCKKCQSQELEFRYGPHGYYLKCLKCDANTSIKLDCRQCGRQTKLRKQDQMLFVECGHCKLSEVLHRNDRPVPEIG